jgi:hypothetical protein
LTRFHRHEAADAIARDEERGAAFLLDTIRGAPASDQAEAALVALHAHGVLTKDAAACAVLMLHTAAPFCIAAALDFLAAYNDASHAEPAERMRVHSSPYVRGAALRYLVGERRRARGPAIRVDLLELRLGYQWPALRRRILSVRP